MRKSIQNTQRVDRTMQRVLINSLASQSNHSKVLLHFGTWLKRLACSVVRKAPMEDLLYSFDFPSVLINLSPT
uniref:Uncharacterized protein n=1 Tax=Utricularia reniformis TaxID=192314 RepID=A0A1Y0B3T3_9LAMI|nr:hypothetical protein AEK19_MT1818 [Utricularia reniformis]ART31989.1 hypothetical protein AEK19_MT1818 [Utricularia reniformis]